MATTDGGAFCTEGYSDPPGTLKLSNLTLLDNVADNGSALELRGQSEVYLRNTAMQNGQNLTNCSGTGSVVDGGFNLDSGDDCNLGVTSLSLTDAMLGPLDDNGGPTETSLPLTGSPLVDGGDPLGCLDVFGDAVVVDQRAEPRPVDGDGADGPRCDIGAVESPLACLDVDGDGFPAQASPLCPGGESAPLDCDDADATVWATPGVVGELLLTDAQTLAWSAPVDPGATVSSLLYDVGVATVASGWVEGVNASCLASGVAGTMLTDSQAPQPGELVYYLVRATNGCPDGDGSWGVDSSGVVRSADVCE